jgi:hypothetical protein
MLPQNMTPHQNSYPDLNHMQKSSMSDMGGMYLNNNNAQSNFSQQQQQPVNMQSNFNQQQQPVNMQSNFNQQQQQPVNMQSNFNQQQPGNGYLMKSMSAPTLYDDTMYAIKNLNNLQIDPELLKHYHDINPKLAGYNLEQHFYQGDRNNGSLHIDPEILNLYTQINPKLQLLPDIMVYCI